MGRNSDEPLGAVRINEDLGLSVVDVQALGFRVLEHWSLVPAISERDAYQLKQRQRTAFEQHERQHDQMQADQRQWQADREMVYRRTYVGSLGRERTPTAHAKARQDAQRAIKFEQSNDPTKIGFPESIKTDPAVLEVELLDDASGWNWQKVS